MKQTRLPFFAVLVAGVFCQYTVAKPKKTTQKTLVEQVQTIALSVGAAVGVYAVNLKSGYVISINGKKRFPLASTYKVPMGILFCEKVASGKAHWNTPYLIHSYDLRPGDSFLSARFAPGFTLSNKDIFRYMIELSDNTATDIILKMIGGPEAVTAWLNSVGITDMHVDRSTLDLIADCSGVTDVVDDESFDLNKYYKKRNKAPRGKRREEILNTFFKDPRDTGTPVAMARVLDYVYQHKDTTCQPLYMAMRLCLTGLQGIPSLLPEGIEVAQKTGALCCFPHDPAVTNDVGLVSLPDGSMCALVIFTKNSRKGPEARRIAIAKIARVVYKEMVRATQESLRKTSDQLAPGTIAPGGANRVAPVQLPPRDCPHKER